MAQTKALSKILNVREKEEKDAQIAHHQSVSFFEKMATQLYQLLKRKEDAEDSYEKFMKNPACIDQIKEQLDYIETLNQQIIELQDNVKKARIRMETKQEKLTYAHVEVKKYEKLIENRMSKKKLLELKLEQNFLDEISTQQFLKRKKGEDDGKEDE